MNIGLIILISLAMFTVGLFGTIFKRNALIFFLSIELMLNAANLLFVAFSRYWGNELGLAWVFFVLVVAAAEAAIGLAIIIHLFRRKQVVDLDRFDELRG